MINFFWKRFEPIQQSPCRARNEIRLCPPPTVPQVNPCPTKPPVNHAAGVLKTISADQRAETVRRFYLWPHRYLQPPAKRVISHAVFVYFR